MASDSPSAPPQGRPPGDLQPGTLRPELLATGSDAALASRAAGGSSEAFAVLVRRHQRSVFNLIVRMVRDPGEAEELAQDAFLKAYRRLDTFDPALRFSSWLLKIAHNTAIDHLRRRHPGAEPLDDLRHVPDPDPGPGPWPAAAPDPERQAVRGEIAAALEAALDRLRPAYRLVIVLRYHEELSHEEIADITGLPIGTVKSHLYRARVQMAAQLARSGWAPHTGQGASPRGATRSPGGS